MPTVTDQEFETCLNLCSMEAEIYSVAAARFYIAKNGNWEYSGCTGICSVLSDGPSYYIRMFDSDCKKIIFEQELYEGFLYTKNSPWFHTFEMNENIGGLSFSDNAEGEDIFENVIVAAEEIGGGAGQSGPPQAAPQVQYNEEPQYEEEYYEEPQQQAPPPQQQAPPPQQQQAPPPQQQAPPPQQQQAPPQQQQAPPRQAAPAANSPSQKNQRKKGKKEKKKKKKRGLFSRKKKPKKQKMEIVIGGPTNFQHESHIGWDLDNGFDIRNIPPEWRKLFQAAGVKKSELQDPETRKMIMETVGESMNGGGLPPGGPPPPGPPPGGPPPPGPPPPGPPPPSSGPPPPGGGPPPPSRGSPGPPAARELSLQEQLAQKRNKLADANQRQVASGPVAGAPKASLADTLAAAMMARRGAVDVDDEAQDDDDDWSDEDWDDDDW